MFNRRKKSRIKPEENPIPKNKPEEKNSIKDEIPSQEVISEPIIEGTDTIVDDDDTIIIDDDTNETIITDDDTIIIDDDDTIITDTNKPVTNNSTHDYQYEFDSDRSYVFIFGPSNVGKTVIIGSLLKYLKSYRGREHGDTLKNINNKDVPWEREGNILWKDLTIANTNNRFPAGTSTIGATSNFRNNPAPRHLNLHYLPARNIPEFKFCFLDIAGEDLEKLDYESSRPLPKTIETYIEDVPKQNMCFIFVVDPQCATATKDQQIVLFDAFIETLDSNDHTETPLLILVSKWDTLKKQFENVQEYLEAEFEDVWGVANQVNRNISVAEFSIGEVDVLENRPLNFDHSYPERVFNWLYETQMGTSLKEEDDETESFISRLLKIFKRR